MYSAEMFTTNMTDTGVIPLFRERDRAREKMHDILLSLPALNDNFQTKICYIYKHMQQHINKYF
jgi:hypothetical protein